MAKSLFFPQSSNILWPLTLKPNSLPCFMVVKRPPPLNNSRGNVLLTTRSDPHHNWQLHSSRTHHWHHDSKRIKSNGHDVRGANAYGCNHYFDTCGPKTSKIGQTTPASIILPPTINAFAYFMSWTDLSLSDTWRDLFFCTFSGDTSPGVEPIWFYFSCDYDYNKTTFLKNVS